MNSTEVILLSDSDDDVAPVARMPSPRRGGDDSDIEIIDSPSPNHRKRRRKPAFKSDPPSEAVEVVRVKALPPTPLEQVLAIIPDVALDHAQKLLKEHHNVAANVLNALLEGGSYPKDPGKKPSVAPGGGAVVKLKSSEPSLDFMSASSFEPTEAYKIQATEQLQHIFPCLTKAGAKFMLEKSSNHFAIAHDRIVRLLKGGEGTSKAKAASLGNDDDDEEVNQFKKLKACTEKKATVDEEQKKDFQKLFGCAPKKTFFSIRPRVKQATITDPILIEEVAFVRGKLRKWEDQVEAGIIRKENRDMAVKEGTALDCLCCYESVAMDEMVQCREGHLFCQDCLSNYVENQIFANGNFGIKQGTKEPALELLCFHGDGCVAGFDRFFLKKALKEKVLEKYDELQSQVNLEKAGLGDTICACPQCGYTAEVPPSLTVFLCPNVACRFESCRKCREASHVPLRCDEVEKKQEEEGRCRVEEAASAAVIRFCPKCKKGIVKSDGCNKMTCGCGTKFCYLCRAIVKDYTHFCQRPHCDHKDPRKCTKPCPLYTQDLDVLHEKNMREAALAEAARVAEEAASSQQPTAKRGLFGREVESQPATSVNIDVDSILQAPKRQRT